MTPPLPHGSLPVTSIQRGMILASIQARSTPMYHMQLTVELSSLVEVSLLESAWDRVLTKHPGLMSQFEFRSTRIVQSLESALEGSWRQIELPSGAEGTAMRDRLIEEHYARPFEFGVHRALWRVLLLCRPDGPSWWSLVCHHALVDRESYLLILDDLFQMHERLHAGEERASSEAAPSFMTYLKWQQTLDRTQHESFWRGRFGTLIGAPGQKMPEGGQAAVSAPRSEPFRLAGPTPLVPIPGSSCQTRSTPERIEVEIPPDLDRDLRRLARETGVTINSILQGAWALWLSRSTDETRVLLGAMRGCRKGTISEAERRIGPYLNTLPLLVEVPDDISVAQWLRGVRGEWTQLREVTHGSLDMVHEWSGFDPGSPLFHSAVNFEYGSFASELKERDLEKYCRLIHNRGNLPIPIVVVGYENPSIQVSLTFRPDVVSRDYASRAALSLGVILEVMARSPERRLGTVSLVSDEERASIRTRSSGPEVPSPAGLLAHHLFEDRVRRQPDSPALVRDGQTWTYADIDLLARQVAAGLAHSGVGARAVVGVVMPASPQLVITILGILKAGATFFVMNPDLPLLQRARMLEAARLEAVVIRAPSTQVDEAVVRVLIYDDLVESRPVPVEHSVEERDLAYMVHTSGSTGEAKFVEIEHRSIVNCVRACIRAYGLTPQDRRFQRAPPGTDFFIGEILTNLSAGCTIVFHRTGGVLGIQEFLLALEELEITVTGMPTSYWHEWCRTMVRTGITSLPRSLRLVIAGMEKADLETLRAWHRLVGGRVRWINVYGPSEATCIAMTFEVSGELPPNLENVPIGRPIPNTAVLVLDPSLRCRPVGMVGEICITGWGLMRGYRDVGQESQGRLVENPFDHDSGSPLLYRTGDLGYALPDGNIVFCGRRDNQVKVRGQRVELEAVESALSRAAGGSPAVAFLDEGSQPPSLTAVIEVAAPLDEATLLASLSQQLVSAMVPARILAWEHIPTLPNGKVDRAGVKARADRDRNSRESLPVTSIESTDESPEALMLRIFQRLMQRPSLTVTADFLDAGADSLTLVRVAGEIEQLLGWTVPLGDVYRARTVRKLAQLQAQGSLPSPVRYAPADGVSDRSAPIHVLGIPSTTGVSRTLHRISRYWAADSKLWCFEQEPVRLDPQEFPIPHLARNYARIIGKDFEGKTVVLFGYCSGALIAWETARLLLGSQVHLSDVILLDPPSRLNRSVIQLFRLHLRMTADHSLLQRGAHFWRLLRRRVERLASWPTEGRETTSREQDLARFSGALSRDYHPGHYPGRVRLLRCRERLEVGGVDRYDRYWRERSGSCRFYDLDGDHTHVLGNDEIEVTMQLLNRVIQDCSGDTGSVAVSC